MSMIFNAIILGVALAQNVPPPSMPQPPADMPPSVPTPQMMQVPTTAPAIDPDRPLPPNARRVIDYYGELQAEYERVTTCSGDACSEAVVERATGTILFIHGEWQPGSVETGFGQEVITAIAN